MDCWHLHFLAGRLTFAAQDLKRRDVLGFKTNEIEGSYWSMSPAR
jgi:hypothetical protein